MLRIMLVLVGLILVAWLLWSGPFSTTNTNQSSSSTQSEDTPQPALESFDKQLSDDTQTQFVVQDPNPYQEQALKSQIMQVADLYAEQARYPHFSQPILDPQTINEPEPFEETEVDTPFPTDDEALPIHLLVATERYQYFTNETIRTRLRLHNAPSDAFISATGTLSGSAGDTPLTIEFQLDPDNQQWFADFNTALIPPALLSPEMLIKVVVQIDEAPYFTTVGIRYQAAEANLTGIAWARPEGAFLNIALQYDVSTSGYYFSNGILADAQSGQPLIQLQAEGPMQQGNSVLIMKAHIQALRAVNSEGPYVLRTIRTFRGAETGEQFDKPAATLEQSYTVPGFAFERYEDTEYVDPLAQERIEFLQQLGGLEN